MEKILEGGLDDSSSKATSSTIGVLAIPEPVIMQVSGLFLVILN